MLELFTEASEQNPFPVQVLWGQRSSDMVLDMTEQCLEHLMLDVTCSSPVEQLSALLLSFDLDSSCALHNSEMCAELEAVVDWDEDPKICLQNEQLSKDMQVQNVTDIKCRRT